MVWLINRLIKLLVVAAQGQHSLDNKPSKYAPREARTPDLEVNSLTL